MRRFSIELSDHVFERLQSQAIAERRPLREQAAWLIELALGFRSGLSDALLVGDDGKQSAN